jgi:hypothetical protein
MATAGARVDSRWVPWILERYRGTGSCSARNSARIDSGTSRTDELTAFPCDECVGPPSCFARFYNSFRELAIDRVYQAIP